LIRRVAVLCFALLALLSGPLVAAAQDGSPVAGAPVGPKVGTAVSWVGNEGTELAKVTVTGITDPFKDYDPSSPPQRGSHFVLLAVKVENTGTAPVTVDPSAFGLVDADGFVAHSTGLYRSTAATTATPDLQSGDVAPGTSVSGVVGFQVLNGVKIERVVFAPDSSRLITLVDKRIKRTPIGTAVSIIGTDGTEVGQVNVKDLTDPFQGYDPSNPPQRGSRYVVIDVTVTNTGTQTLTVAPYSFYLVDADGFVANPTYLYRADVTNPPDFQGGDIAAGASMSGIIAFQLLSGTKVASVLYTASTYDQLVIVGEPAAGGSPQPKPTPRTAQATPTTAAALASAADCAGVETWAKDSVARLNQIGTLFAPLGALATQPNAKLDPAQLRQMVTQLQTLADAQRNSKPPAVAEALNTALVTAIQSATDAVTSLADAAEKNDQAAELAAAKKLQDAGNLFSDPNGNITKLATALETACPAIKTVLGG
jgi:hypothetical protein